MSVDAPFYQRGAQVFKPGAPRIVCVADHASNRVPPGIDLGIAPALLDEHIAIDIGVAGVCETLAMNHGFPAHLANVSRLVCDFHREEDHPALVPEFSDGYEIPGNKNADIDGRLSRFYRPYHAALADWLDRLAPDLILSIHSFTPQLATSKEARPWQLGLLYNQDPRAARIAIDLLRARGFTVGDNEPYSGRELNATMNRHAEAHGRAYCAIEIRQDCIATPPQQADWAAILADIAPRVAKALA